MLTRNGNLAWQLFSFSSLQMSFHGLLIFFVAFGLIVTPLKVSFYFSLLDLASSSLPLVFCSSVMICLSVNFIPLSLVCFWIVGLVLLPVLKKISVIIFLNIVSTRTLLWNCKKKLRFSHCSLCLLTDFSYTFSHSSFISSWFILSIFICVIILILGTLWFYFYLYLSHHMLLCLCVCTLMYWAFYLRKTLFVEII